MEEYQQFYSKVVLIKHAVDDFTILEDKMLELQIDVSFTIGKSVAVLHDGRVIGHLARRAAKTVWIHLKCGHKVEARVYTEINEFKNTICFSNRSKSPEVGIEIRIFFVDVVDGARRISGNNQATSFLGFFVKHHLNSFPGVTQPNCPPSLIHFM